MATNLKHRVSPPKKQSPNSGSHCPKLSQTALEVRIRYTPIPETALSGAVSYIYLLAEGEGFEPPVPFRAQRFSRPPVSTAHPSLRMATGILRLYGERALVLRDDPRQFTLIPVHAELTTQEAVEMLKISRPSLIQLLERRRPPSVRSIGIPIEACHTRASGLPNI